MGIGAFCLWVSVSLIIRMWLVERSASVFKRILWSVMLLIPLFGWLAYGAWFHIPSRHGMSAPQGAPLDPFGL